ncbi:MAG: hypothetical protein E4H01_11550 [Lysobacterales bacterium]|nr:MAG: hypothetical protein E4H01_11550 [Xanthomonadales bacterium]
MSRKILYSKIKTLNTLLGFPLEPYAEDDAGHYAPQANCIFSKHNTHYGYRIAQMVEEGSGERNLLEGTTLRAAIEFVSGALWAHRILKP